MVKGADHAAAVFTDPTRDPKPADRPRSTPLSCVFFRLCAPRTIWAAWALHTPQSPHCCRSTHPQCGRVCSTPRTCKGTAPKSFCIVEYLMRMLRTLRYLSMWTRALQCRLTRP